MNGQPPRHKGDFGVYVHWPFCAAKCPYCDFNSHVRHGAVDEAGLVTAYARELAHMRNLTGARSVTSIFFGGGTPSLMAGSTVAAILATIDHLWGVADDTEITLEANPSSADATRFADYRAAGVNRLSVGVQSLRDHALKTLGRLHDAAEARQAVALARSIFEEISFDLIYARPGQTVDEWQIELKEALGFAADHLSLYQLTIEPGTPFFDLHRTGKLSVPGDDEAEIFYQETLGVTDRHGLPAYEISNHARPGSECRHNLVYWRQNDYAGVGPGAHGRIDTASGRLATAATQIPEIWREAVERHGHGLATSQILNVEEQADEMLVMGLRLAEGIDADRYRQLSGRPLNQRKIAELQALGFVEPLADNKLRVSRAGWMVLDAVVADLAA